MEQFYFGEDPHRLFGALARPAGRAHTGLVFCPPFGEEMTCTYARFAIWAKQLAHKGFAVLRYHPRGAGESNASFAEFTLSGAATGAATAVRWLREHAEVESVGMFGLRFGASVAVEAARAAQPDFLVFWSPVINLRQYLREILRLRLTKELVHQKAGQVKVTAKDMTDELEAGRSIDLLGYEISPELYRQMSASRSWPQEIPAPEVLWLVRSVEQAQAEAVVSAWRSQGCQADVRAFREPVFWEDFSSDFPQQFAAASIAWMGQRAAQAVRAR